MKQETQPTSGVIRTSRPGGRLLRRGDAINSSWVIDNPWLLKTPGLTQVGRDLLKTYNPFDDPLVKREQERRAREPKVSLGTFDEWVKYVALRERLEREAAARGDVEIDYSQLPWRPQPQEPPATPEQQRARDIPILNTLHARMAKEARDAQFDGMATSIQEKIWKEKPPRLAIKPTEQLKIMIRKDGSVMNRSRFGATVSYTHKDIATSNQREELSFGIGYFGDRAAIVPEAQAAITDAQLEKGVKGYYVERSYTYVDGRGRIVRQKKLVVVPMGYTESIETFFEKLYVNAKLVSPDAVVPKAKQRVKAYRRNGYYAEAA